MEELRSTEALDREILEDARKKAFKILKTAEDAQAAQTRDWDKKIQASVDSIRGHYEEKTKKIREELFARLPLDKRRLRSETAESALKKAMDDFLRGLPREKLLSILEHELSPRIKAFADAGALVRYSGMDLSETKDLLKKVSAPADLEFKEESLAHEFPFIVINTQAVKISASV